MGRPWLRLPCAARRLLHPKTAPSARHMSGMKETPGQCIVPSVLAAQADRVGFARWHGYRVPAAERDREPAPTNRGECAQTGLVRTGLDYIHVDLNRSTKAQIFGMSRRNPEKLNVRAVARQPYMQNDELEIRCLACCLNSGSAGSVHGRRTLPKDG